MIADLPSKPFTFPCPSPPQPPYSTPPCPDPPSRVTTTFNNPPSPCIPQQHMHIIHTCKTLDEMKDLFQKKLSVEIISYSMEVHGEF